MAIAPRLDVPGMAGFALGGMVLGLVPESGIRHLPDPADPAQAGGLPRAELYLPVEPDATGAPSPPALAS